MNTQALNWLSSQLPRGTSLQVSPLPIAASFRRFYRVDTGLGTYVLMDAPPTLEDSPRFVRVARLLAAHNVPVPDVLAHSEPLGLVLMSDLGTRSLEDAYAAGDTEAAVLTAVDRLIGLQQVPAAALPPYTAGRLGDELNIFADWYVSRWLGQPLHEAWSDWCRQLVAEIARQPVRCVHRDYHCQNLLLSKDGRFGVVDFQDALAGPALYDLASLLRDCYFAHEPALVARALHRFMEATDLPIDEPQRALDLTALQRQLKAVGIFARLSLRDGKPTHLRYIQPVLRQSIPLAGAHAPFQPLGEWLAALPENPTI